MKIFFILCFSFQFLCISNGDQPKSVCADTHPFRLTENKCANFDEICFKQGDDQCNQLQNACKQCPPEKLLLKTIQFLWIIIIIILFAFVIIILLLMENRLKLIGRLLRSITNTRGSGNYVPVENIKTESLKFENKSQQINEIINSIKNIEEKIKSKFLRIDQDIKFITEEENKPIILNISSTDNVVRVKRQICKKWSKAEPNYYKIMKLIYKEKTLDDNEYLLSCIHDGDAIYCIIDYAIMADDIVVVHIDGVPKCDTELIQLHTNDTIDQLKNIIHKLYNYKNISIYQKCENSEKFNKLEDCKTVEKYKLKDNDIIKIVEKQNGRVSISSIFDEKHLGYVDFTNTDLVSIIYDQIRKRERSEDFLLSLYNQYLDREYFIFQYNIEHETEIKYLQFHKLDCLKERREIISDNEIVFKAKDQFVDREIFVKKYKSSKENDYSNLLRELNTFTIIKSDPRFVQLYGAYKDGKDFYISMEYFTRGSLRNILSKQENRKNIQSKDVIKWSKQILEGINYLNNHGIIHGNLTTSSIMLDENNEIKLSSFGMSKYIKSKRTLGLSHMFPVTVSMNTYRSPEIIDQKPFGIKVDVWSFGIILGEIITGQTDREKILDKLNQEFTLVNVEDNSTQENLEISEHSSNKDNEMFLPETAAGNPENNYRNSFIDMDKRVVSKFWKEIIEKCLIKDPQKRISVKELINNHFIKLN